MSDGPSSAFLRAFFRYSADRVHWSSWYMLRSVAPTETLAPGEFDAWLQLPDAARERYAELMREWWQTKPTWSSDEHEFCVWLANQHRGYFATEVPFAGYVQVRAEGEAHAMRIAGLIISQSSMGSGFSAVPQGTRRASADGPWFFDLNKTGGR